MTTPMIQRMAEAMAREDYAGEIAAISAKEAAFFISCVWPTYAAKARAALEAMLEPTEAMMEASFGPDDYIAAIKAALQETKDAVGREGE